MLRAELAKRGLSGLILPRADRHQNEYVPACEDRLGWLTGFSGSFGVAVVLMEKAALWLRVTAKGNGAWGNGLTVLVQDGSGNPEGGGCGDGGPRREVGLPSIGTRILRNMAVFSFASVAVE